MFTFINAISPDLHNIQVWRGLWLHSSVIVTIPLTTYIVPKSVTNGFWHSILKTMLLSEAWPEEFQICIIRKHINHNSWNIYDNNHTPHNLLAAFHCFRVLFFLGRTVYIHHIPLSIGFLYQRALVIKRLNCTQVTTSPTGSLLKLNNRWLSWRKRGWWRHCLTTCSPFSPRENLPNHVAKAQAAVSTRGCRACCVL